MFIRLIAEFSYLDKDYLMILNIFSRENGAPDDTDTYGIVASFLGTCLSLG